MPLFTPSRSPKGLTLPLSLDTGTSPFKGSNEMDLLRTIRTKELRLPEDAPPLSKPSLDIMHKVSYP
ncbi:hypothetical protein EON65_30165 [archaeon]|nr:MAG: hypothetical protein EON65_30165 [archaeon]